MTMWREIEKKPKDHNEKEYTRGMEEMEEEKVKESVEMSCQEESESAVEEVDMLNQDRLECAEMEVDIPSQDMAENYDDMLCHECGDILLESEGKLCTKMYEQP